MEHFIHWTSLKCVNKLLINIMQLAKALNLLVLSQED